MTKTKHTPLPWFIMDYMDYEETKQVAISDETATRYIAVLDDNDETDEANAAFIVRACNNHYELLEALENAANVLAGIATGDLKTIDRDSPALLKARTAIAKAEGVKQ